MSNDPFAGLGSTTTTEDAPEIPADILAYFDLGEVIGEEDFLAPEPFGGPKFIKPADKSIVPVRITSASVTTKAVDIVVVREPDGRVITNYLKVNEAIDGGATAEVERVEIPRFELEADLAAECYNDKGRSYLLGFPVLSVKMAYSLTKRKGKKGKNLGWNIHAGRNLVRATGVLDSGQKLTADLDQLKTLAQKMIGTIVMAQIRYVPKTYTDEVAKTYTDGSPVKAKINKHGSFIRVTRALIENGTVAIDDNGVPVPAKDGETSTLVLEDSSRYEGPEDQLIEHEGRYLIVDNSNGATVRTTQERTVDFDNLRDDVAPLPQRSITVHRTNGTEDQAEITLDTVGKAVPLNKSGFMTTQGGTTIGTAVQAVTAGGELLTASWMGTHWEETPKQYELTVSETGHVRLSPVDDGDPDLSGLGEFAGD